MADPAEIAAVIRDRAAAYGVDPDTLLRQAQVESGLNPNSANPASSAKGLFNFVDSTWKQYGNGANPLDPYANADAGARFMANNQKLLRSANLEPTPGNTYLAHFAGPGGALKVLRADPGMSAAAVMGPEAVKANPFLANMTVADLRSWADHKMGGGAPMQTAAVAPPAAGGAPLTPTPTEGTLTPELLAQLSSVPKMIAAQEQAAAAAPPSAPISIDTPQHIKLARAAILARAIAGKPIV